LGVPLLQVQRFALVRQRTESARVFSDWNQLVAASDVDVTVETMGGTNEVRQFVLASLKLGKRWSQPTRILRPLTVTNSLLSPPLRTYPLVLRRVWRVASLSCERSTNPLWGDPLRALHRILNGTSNYILTQMENRGIPSGVHQMPYEREYRACLEHPTRYFDATLRVLGRPNEADCEMNGKTANKAKVPVSAAAGPISTSTTKNSVASDSVRRQSTLWD
jgi:hypothetical protein